MNYYENAQICLNGHVISNNINNDTLQEHCSKCGAKTITECPDCHAPVHGSHVFDAFMVDPNYKIPAYCHNCGRPYPWTETFIDNAVALIDMDDEMENDTKKLLKDAIPNLMVDTPATSLSIAKYQKAIPKASDILRECLYSLLVGFISEPARKALFDDSGD